MQAEFDLLQRGDIAGAAVDRDGTELFEQPADEAGGEQLLLCEKAELRIRILHADQDRVGHAPVIADEQISALVGQILQSLSLDLIPERHDEPHHGHGKFIECIHAPSFSFTIFMSSCSEPSRSRSEVSASTASSACFSGAVSRVISC